MRRSSAAMSASNASHWRASRTSTSIISGDTAEVSGRSSIRLRKALVPCGATTPNSASRPRNWFPFVRWVRKGVWERIFQTLAQQSHA
jgi:hypothetical protein